MVITHGDVLDLHLYLPPHAITKHDFPYFTGRHREVTANDSVADFPYHGKVEGSIARTRWSLFRVV